MAIQAILIEHHRMVATRDTYTWIHKYTFPGGLLPATEAITSVVDEHTSLHVSRVAPLGQHYAQTLRLWCERFLSNWPHVQELGFDETFRRMWEFYLACEAGFRTGYLDVAQIELTRQPSVEIRLVPCSDPPRSVFRSAPFGVRPKSGGSEREIWRI